MQVALPVLSPLGLSWTLPVFRALSSTSLAIVSPIVQEANGRAPRRSLSRAWPDTPSAGAVGVAASAARPF